MLSLDDMPDFRSDLASVHVEFPPLDMLQTARHAEFIPKLMEYLESETGVYDPADLTFLRSAQVAESRFWIWEFYDCSGEHAYATVEERPGRGACYGYNSSDGLTPEQTMLADYHACY